MLRYISKTRFEEHCKGIKPIKTILIDSFDCWWPYYELPEKESWAMYLSELSAFVVFGSPEINENDLILDFSDWTLTQISKKPDPKYILNLMKMHCNLNYDFGKTCGTGIWELVNSRTGERFEFSIKKTKDYFESVGIGYPEKLEVPIDKVKIQIIDKFIEELCYGLRCNNS